MATPDQLRKLQREAERKAGAPAPRYRRYGFNPLSSRPAVAELASTLLIPVPAFVFRQASPLGLYYTGLARWGKAFADDLGELFEVYVGRQLGLLRRPGCGKRQAGEKTGAGNAARWSMMGWGQAGRR